TMDALRNAVRQHWHRGASLLMEDWQAANADLDQFLHTMINRRADLPDVAARQATSGYGKVLPKVEIPTDVSAKLVKALSDIGVTAEIKGLAHGPRVTRYRVFLPDINQLDKLRKCLERLSLVLSLERVPTLDR